MGLFVTLSAPTAATAATTQGTFTSISAGGSHACGIRPDKTVACWGDNQSGQVGDEDGGIYAVPQTVAGLTNVVELALGDDFSLARRSDGTVWSWGADYRGQRGDGDPVLGPDVDPWAYRPPAAIPGLTGIKALAAGADFALALTTAGTVRAWGFNRYGQLGDGTRRQKTAPITITGLTGVTAIAAGRAHSLAVTSAGVRAWGENYDGAVGNNTDLDQFRPVAVTGFPVGVTVTAVAAGNGFSLARLSNGRLMSWGNNSMGQLGRGQYNYESSLVPVAVAGITTASQIEAGTESSYAVLSDGKVSMWGFNVISTRLDLYNAFSVPTPLVGVTASQVAVTDGWDTTLLVRSATNVVQSWGENYSGVLGSGVISKPSYLK